jgi:hypothetical protein
MNLRRFLNGTFFRILPNLGKKCAWTLCGLPQLPSEMDGDTEGDHRGEVAQLDWLAAGTGSE